MIARFSRSWSLIKASGSVLRQDKELMVFPLCSAIAAPLIVSVLALIAVAVILLALIHAALQGVYAAALYRHATTGDAGSAFCGALLSQAFRAK